ERGVVDRLDLIDAAEIAGKSIEADIVKSAVPLFDEIGDETLDDIVSLRQRHEAAQIGQCIAEALPAAHVTPRRHLEIQQLCKDALAQYRPYGDVGVAMAQ